MQHDNDFVLSVEIVEALHLKKLDKETQTSSPYAVAILGVEAQRTQTISMEADHPIWNHRMFFKTSNLLQSLEIQVHHLPLKKKP